ncbi:MAG: M3 family metallopeptidase [Ignavibacteria bacterium]|jgi:peptidyl-dipeptidase Dcp|nr:M3 family metallopeptidase [Ignavibacteria bacterium]
MKKYFAAALAAGMIFSTACSNKDAETTDASSDNPFYTEWNTPFGAPPFEKIKPEHYKQALDSGLRAHSAEIEVIANNAEEATFENTILAMENSGRLLMRASSVFYNVVGADGDEELKALEEFFAPIFTQHSDDINMNERLFARVKSVYDKRDALKLDSDDYHLLELYYKNFVRGGTNLTADKKEELKKVNSNLSKLTTLFGQKLLNDNNAFKVIISDKNDLKGLPESSITAAAELAKSDGQAGKWEFNTSKPSWIPFMQFSDNRALREKMYNGYVNRGNNGDANDTKETIEKIAILRTKKAQLLGYKTWADYIISDNMAKTAKKAYDLIADVAKTTIPYAKAEALELQSMADKLGDKITIEPWDWWYYSEKVRKEKYDLNEDMIRPYFALDNVLKGSFDLATRLYGLKFVELKDMPKHHKDLICYEVKRADDSHLGVIYFDFFPRATKRAGAWMNCIKEEWYENGERSAPIIINVHNLTPPADGNTSDLHNALLSIDEAETVFHEFGHGLQGLFANTKYRSTSGTNVSRDYVELPSQVHENWTTHPQFLKTFAKHYKTGEAIPDSLIAKMQASAKFNQGFITLELIAASILDMDWHLLADTNRRNAIDFEAASMQKMGLIKEIKPRYSSWYFNHIWGSDFGYSAGYYGYTWAAVLDADAFHAFLESGDIFNQDLATKFRDNVLSLGGSYDADVLYRNFRGKDATPAAFYERKGFVKK